MEIYKKISEFEQKVKIIFGAEMVKAKIKKIIESNLFFTKLFTLHRNNFFEGKVAMYGMGIRNNRIKLSENCSIRCGKECNIQDNRIYVQGDRNSIEIGNNVEFLGNEKIASILISGNNNSVVIEDNCKFQNVQFFVQGDNNKIYIHRNCSVVYADFHIESDSVKKQNTIEIFDETTIHGRNEKKVEIFLDEGTNVIIGSDCMLSNNILIRTTDSHSIVDNRGVRINPAKDVIIGNHCWLGANVTVLKGVTISEKNVIAAGSICTKSFTNSNTIIAGSPAKVVKEEVDWCRKQL